MTSGDYCDFCDLPLSQCVHGRPPPAEPGPAVRAKPAVKAAPAKRAAPVRSRTAPTAAPPAVRRWTPPETFEPVILDLLREAGGELTSDEALAALENVVADRLLPGDTERTPDGELRWHLAARKARIALLASGSMVKSRPGVWQLA